MDRLRSILAAVKKQHFWVLCGVVVAAGIAVWWLGTTGVEGDYSKRADEIEGSRAQVQGILSEQSHPNDDVIKVVREQTLTAVEKVYRTWSSLYQAQQAENPPPESLGTDFREAFLNTPLGAELPVRHRDTYMNRIGRHIPKLLEMGNIVRLDPESGAAGRAGGPGNVRAATAPPNNMSRALSEEETIGVVLWDPSDWEAIERRFTWAIPPSTEEVRMAQEDLWVYEALMKIIQRTNGPVKSPSDAAIKEIYALRIGSGASAAWESSDIADARAQPGGKRMRRASAASSADGPDEDVLQEGRYVDAEGKPLPAEEECPFKLMPIYLQLRIDQRKLPKLLVECVNSSMPVEVCKVSLTTSQLDTGNVTQLGLTQDGTLDATIEIRGTICIYNPADLEMLGVEPGSEEWDAVLATLPSGSATQPDTAEQPPEANL